MFVAVAIMQLKDKSLLTLDDPVDQYYDYPIRNPYFLDIPISIKMILTHTSSFQDTDMINIPYGETLFELFHPKGKYYTQEMVLKIEGKPVKPGTRYHYYNTGFQLLAGIIETISGERFDHYIENHILKPLAMKGSFNPSSAIVKTWLKPTYRKLNHVWEPQIDKDIKFIDTQSYVLGTNGSLFSPQGGLRSNASELSYFMKFLMLGDERILSQSSIMDMISLHFPVEKNQTNDEFCRNNGIGFNIITKDYFNRPIKDMSYTLVGHCGIAYGCLGIFFFDPLSKNGLIFITRGHGKPLSDYQGHYSNYFNFQEEMLTYVDQHIWRTS
ncbi:MAG: hypothetical protein A2221_07980 [Tenericutes bacterium RIFOXYA2_FULL_36_32]|nr:MAG: hypothetical protein A2221_07980 [Tenericutes bacterium RIFOXYA2_FULL_36_32]